VLGNPANRNRAIPLTYDQFRYPFANAVSEEEVKAVRDLRRAGAREAALQAATANLNPWTEAKVDTDNPDRGPLLIISGEKDHTVPWALANGAYKQQKDNKGVTEIVEIKGREHGLTIDRGWREVADTALAFVKRFTYTRPARSPGEPATPGPSARPGVARGVTRRGARSPGRPRSPCRRPRSAPPRARARGSASGGPRAPGRRAPRTLPRPPARAPAGSDAG
jgi:hypothetical protein